MDKICLYWTINVLRGQKYSSQMSITILGLSSLCGIDCIVFKYNLILFNPIY